MVKNTRMASRMATHRYYIQHSRFTKQDGWRLYDVSLSLKGNIAVTGGNVNTHRTYIDVYTNVRHFDCRDKPKVIYSKEFEKYQTDTGIHHGRLVSFIDDDVSLVSCVGDKLEVIHVNKAKVLRSRKINGLAECLSVRERREIFFGFCQSNKLTVYDVTDLKKIKSIILQGIQDGYWPYDMTITTDKIFVCTTNRKDGNYYKSLIFEEKNGKMLSELIKPTDTVKWYVNTVGVNMNTLGIAVVVWVDSFHYKEGERNTVVAYSLSLSENDCRFPIAEVQIGVTRIRISDRGDRMITGNHWTGEVKVYDMADVFTYSRFKETLASTLQTNDCTKLAKFFKISKYQTDAILRSDRPSENVLLALEEKNVLQPHNIDRLTEAFDELRTNPFCCYVTEIFRKTRSPSYYKEIINKLEEEMKTLKMTYGEEGKELKAHWTHHKAPSGRIYYYNTVTKESRWENPEAGQRDESQTESEELYVNTSSIASEFLEETSFEGEFAKFSVRVSGKLSKANCVKLATYFNFPAAKIYLIKSDVDTPGITLFDILKECHIINIHNVMGLKEALEVLDLKDISDTLVTPYQKKIDRLRFEQQFLSK